MPNSADDPEAIIRDLIAQEMAKITKEGKKRPALVPTNKAPNDEQLNEMKEWIHSLPQDGVLLLQKMEFDFVNSNAFKSNMAGLSDAVSSSMSDEDESSEILMQILMQQAPLPTQSIAAQSLMSQLRVQSLVRATERMTWNECEETVLGVRIFFSLLSA